MPIKQGFFHAFDKYNSRKRGIISGQVFTASARMLTGVIVLGSALNPRALSKLNRVLVLTVFVPVCSNCIALCSQDVEVGQGLRQFIAITLLIITTLLFLSSGFTLQIYC